MGKWGIAPPLLISALDGGEWSASRPGRFTPREIAPGTQWLCGPQSRSGRYEEDTNLAPAGNRTPAVQTVTRCYTY
jgi:hypothetical protein